MKYAVELEPNTDYVAKFYAKSTPNNTFRFSYSAATHGDDTTKMVNVLRVSELTEYTYEFTTGADTAGAHFQFISQSGDGQRFQGEDQITSIIGLKVYKAAVEAEPADPDVLEGAAMPKADKSNITNGDNWSEPATTLKWSGCGPDAQPEKRDVETVQIGGKDTLVYVCQNIHTGSAQITNRFGAFDLKPNTTYIVKLTASTVPGAEGTNGRTVLSCSLVPDNQLVLKTDGEFHDYALVFTTGADATGAYINVGKAQKPGTSQYDTYVSKDWYIKIASLTVEEYTPYENEYDVLEGAAMPQNTKVQIGDQWSRPNVDLTWTGTSATQAYGPLYREIKYVDGQFILSFENAKANSGMAPFENSFGKFDLEANTEYVARVTVRSNKGNKSGSDGTYKAAIYVGTSKADALASIQMKDNTEWNTYELKFTTGADATDLLLGVGDNLNTPNDYWTVGGRVLEISACEIFKEADYEDVKREEELAKATEPTFGNMSPDYFVSVEEIPGPPATGAVVVPVVAAALAVASGVVVFKKRK